MEKKLPLEERSIYEIYLESQETITYSIPIYQRNYAWEDDQISALIKDVHDSFIKDPKSIYYIGTLVTYKRGDNIYEVIDGQQRLTTIYIILKALGYEKIKNHLTYRARKTSINTIDHLTKLSEIDDIDKGIQNGYQFAKGALEVNILKSEQEDFKKYFLDQVHIIHYMVPKDVDLNHYFEVMNSRGEQLEKHEIVKSTLCQQLSSKNEMATFSRVWEACSEMNIYIQQAFDSDAVFGKRMFIIERFEDIPPQDASEGKKTILDLMNESVVQTEDQSTIEQADKFQSIIDFPNLLLIVLKVTMMEYEGFEPSEFILDDKELLNEFGKALNYVADTEEMAKDFILNLLKARYYLDNYIVHHSQNDKEKVGDNPWMLQHYDKKKGYPANLADGNVQNELVHLLSMFEVTFTPKQRKNYLFYSMLYLFNNPKPDGRNYQAFLRQLAEKYFYDIYLNPDSLSERNQPAPNAFDRALLKDCELNLDEIGDVTIDYHQRFKEIYHEGCADIPLFVFNYMDYKLWMMYLKYLRGKKTTKVSHERVNFFKKMGCSDFDLIPFDNFYFSRTRKSLEHYYPRAKVVKDKKPTREQINCFGNFAMISSEANSSGNDLDPIGKILRYTDTKNDPVSISSLKFKIMMQICLDNHKNMINGLLERQPGMEWNVEDMQNHQQKMLDILFL